MEKSLRRGNYKSISDDLLFSSGKAAKSIIIYCFLELSRRTKRHWLESCVLRLETWPELQLSRARNNSQSSIKRISPGIMREVIITDYSSSDRKMIRSGRSFTIVNTRRHKTALSHNRKYPCCAVRPDTGHPHCVTFARSKSNNLTFPMVTQYSSSTPAAPAISTPKLLINVLLSNVKCSNTKAWFRLWERWDWWILLPATDAAATSSQQADIPFWEPSVAGSSGH